jgi:hypothetical protein
LPTRCFTFRSQEVTIDRAQADVAQRRDYGAALRRTRGLLALGERHVAEQVDQLGRDLLRVRIGPRLQDGDQPLRVAGEFGVLLGDIPSKSASTSPTEHVCCAHCGSYPANSHRLIKNSREGPKNWSLAAVNWPDNWEISGQLQGYLVIVARGDGPDIL